ncbi:MAG: NHL repeat-containing protein [Spirochaetia bacterium]|nr:NHL repeat-containing protein [Spirochaetia bacterium]
MSSLSVSASDSSSITLAQPTFSTSGNPTPTVQAYIGVNGTISITGSTVSNSVAGPINVATGGYQFGSLTSNTSYRIIVVSQNSAGYSTQQIVQSTAAVAPVMNSLSITTSDSVSITLAQPTFSTAGNPAPTVNAFIGLDGTISISGSTVSNSVQGPISVSSGGHQFASLSSNTSYRIIVVAQNSAGYYTQQIVQSTAGVSPVLNALAVSGATSSAITLSQPTFATAGNPTATVSAYIGFDGTISISGSTVSNSLQGPIDVSSGGYQFGSLTNSSNYRIIVVAANSVGYYTQQIAQSTTGIAPVLNSLAISASDSVSITLSQPTFSTAGNPAPTVKAYLGLDGTISLNGSVVSSSVLGPIDVASGGHQFSSLLSNTAYRIIVVAENSGGYAVKQIAQSTAGIAPVLNSLVLSNYDATSVTLDQPTFSVAGNPAPTVQAYVGLSGTIIVNGAVVSNFIQGPINVSTGGYQFTGLTTGVVYKVIVVSQNANGYTVRQVVQSTRANAATIVYGQPNMTASTPNNGGISASTLGTPFGGAFDSSGNLYVGDTMNHRVLYFPAGSTTATRVYGQPNFTSAGANNGGITATSLNNPRAIAVDSAGNLYVGDHGNLRVLFFPAGSTTATRVYGQPNFTSNTANNGGVSASSLNGAPALVLDSADNLYVVDEFNARVLFYPTGSVTATRVYGQPDLVSSGNNNGGISANSLNTPIPITLDSVGNLYVGDNANNRVLFFPAGSTTATRVYGQPNFTSNAPNNGGISSTSLSGVFGVALDSSGNLYVTDIGNHRVLFFPSGSTTATRVYGQPDFTSGSANNGGVSATSLNSPASTLLDPSGHMYVFDWQNGRILYFP